MKALHENREVDIMVRPTKQEREIHHIIWDEVIVAYDNWLGTDKEWYEKYILSQAKDDAINDMYRKGSFAKSKLDDISENCMCVLCEISERLYKKTNCNCKCCDFCRTLVGDWNVSAGCLGGLYGKALLGDREAMVTIRNLI